MIYRIITIVAFLCAVLKVDAQPQAQELLEKLRKKYEKVNDAALTFSQTTYLPVAKVTQHVSGTIRMKKNNKFQIETENEILITNGVTVWRMNKTKKQVLIDQYKEDPKNLSPDRLFLNTPKEYNAIRIGTETVDGKELTVLKLTPKSESSTLKSIKLWIDDEELIIRKVETIDFSDTRSTYNILKFSMNSGVSDSAFVFTPPEGFEVIDLR